VIIKELLARLGFEVDDQGLKEFNQILGEAAKGMAAVVGAGVAAAGALGAVAVATANAGDQAAKGAQRTGTTVEEYQRLSFAAEKAGVSQQQLEASLKLANTAMQKAAQNGDDYITTTNGVQIAIKNADGSLKNQTELMEETAEAVQNAESATEKLAIATSIYGQEVGARMVPLLDLGAEGMARLGDEAEALGIVMSEESAKQAETFLDSLTDLKAIATGLRNIIGEALIPVLLDVASTIRDWFLANSDLIRQGLERWARVVAEAVDALANGVVALIGLFDEFRVVGAATFAALLAGAVVLVGVLTASGIIPLWAAFAIVIAQVVAIWTALGLIVEDVVVYFQGGTSAIGAFFDKFRESDGILGSVARAFEALFAVGGEVLTMLGIIGEAFGATGADGSGALDLLANVAIFLVETALKPLAFALDVIALGLQGMAAVMNALEPIARRVWAAIAPIVAGAGALAGTVAGFIPGAGPAPAAAALAPAGAAAPAGGGGAGGGTSNVTNNYHGATREDIDDAVSGNGTQRNRAAMSEFANAEV
jgi:hypothetical protein